MTKHVGGNQPVEGPIKPPRPTTAPGKPAQPSVSGVAGAVQAEGPVDYSSRLPGTSFLNRPSD